MATNTYDDLASGSFDAARWVPLEFPSPDGLWRYTEPSAEITARDGGTELRVEKFEKAHDTIQIFDNPKHLVMSTESFPIPADGSATFGATMTGETIGTDPSDYRLGCAVFHLMDLQNAWIFDHLTTGARSWTLYERLLVPGMVPEDQAFTWVTETPVPAIDQAPSEPRRYEITLDAAAGAASWHVDGKRVFHLASIDIPDSVVLGLSVLTFSPIDENGATSLQGQGAAGWWRDVTATT